ncbi:hypothetical protein AB0I28_17020 [Phytomonospora sp. NPDC050363]|uniref:hypothetical protein n=1 Tax=Phytomonospora sp. NPDC050363 TaxID=3155642 RepID=UPI0033F32B69
MTGIVCTGRELALCTMWNGSRNGVVRESPPGDTLARLTLSQGDPGVDDVIRVVDGVLIDLDGLQTVCAQVVQDLRERVVAPVAAVGESSASDVPADAQGKAIAAATELESVASALSAAADELGQYRDQL